MAARTAQRQGMPVRPATILRLVRRTRAAESATPTLLGVDEWAYRKRRNFKTVLVDLSANRPRTVLPDARATTVASWLQEYPGVEVIARDRAARLPNAPGRAHPMPFKDLRIIGAKGSTAANATGIPPIRAGSTSPQKASHLCANNSRAA